ncbi:MAG: hypothetical protein ACYC0H_17830 [Solirubrobacteraceae bacterium]
MSFDPYASGSEQPLDNDSTTSPPGDSTYARQRLHVPAIALIVSGILNILTALIQIGGTVMIAVLPPGEPQRLMIRMLPPDAAKSVQAQLEQTAEDPQTAKVQSIISNTVGSILTTVVSILTLLGGMRMLSLQSYAICVAGAIGAAIPCISCGGVCCFGEIIGIWALVVLLNVQVREAFQS